MCFCRWRLSRGVSCSRARRCRTWSAPSRRLTPRSQPTCRWSDPGKAHDHAYLVTCSVSCQLKLSWVQRKHKDSVLESACGLRLTRCHLQEQPKQEQPQQQEEEQPPQQEEPKAEQPKQDVQLGDSIGAGVHCYVQAGPVTCRLL